MDLLGGTIDVKSVLGKGSTFVVTLKYKLADEKYYLNKQEENCEVDNAIFNGKHILLAEDNDLNAEIAMAILEQSGLVLDRVEDGLACINRLSEVDADLYDLILMDIQMPIMDGYEATRKIRKLKNPETANIPIIAMTANAFEEDAKRCLAAGMNAHLAKPFQIEDVEKTIVECCGK